MNSELTFRILFFTLFIAAMAIRAYFGWRVRRTGESSWAVHKDAVEREGRWSLLLRPVLFLALIASFVLYMAHPVWLNGFSMALPSGIRWLGAGLGAAGLILLVWVHQTLGKYWSTTLQLKKEHALVTSGPYRWVRHPMYMALVLLFVGLFLVSAVWPFLLLIVVSVLMFYRVVGKEETMMVEQFGEDYRRYMERTGRFLPLRGANAELSIKKAGSGTPENVE